MGGCYAESRADGVEAEPTGIMLPEFDRKENPGTNFRDLIMNIMPQIQYIAYGGASISRQGAFCVVPISLIASSLISLVPLTDTK
jgi:hypothetical protein